MLNWLRKGREALQDPELPITEHLGELRDRLMYSALAIAICAGLGFYYAREIIAFMMFPLKQAMSGLPIVPQLHFTSITEPLFQSFKIALFTGIGLAFPFWVWQVWKFVAPGLYNNEKRLVTPFILSSTGLFLLGTTFAYTLAVPLAYRFLLLYANPYQATQGTPSRGGISFDIEPLPPITHVVKARPGARKLPTTRPTPLRTVPTPRKKPAARKATKTAPKAFPLALRLKRHPKNPKGWQLLLSAPLPVKQMTPDLLAIALLKQKQISFQFRQGNTTHRVLIKSRWPKAKGDFLSASLKPILTLQAYLNVSSWFLLGFGLIFQTPLLILLITYARIISAETLGKYRRHAFVAILIIAAVLTPTGDPINLMVMAIPMYILFEIGLWASRFVEKRRRNREKAEGRLGTSDETTALIAPTDSTDSDEPKS